MAEILVAGAGPAGLMAMHAALERGHGVRLVDIRDPKTPPVNAGVFYLTPNCNLPLRSTYLTITGYGALTGLSEAYSRKVYRRPDVHNSMVRFQHQTVWDAQQAIEFLWDIAETSGAYRQLPEPVNSRGHLERLADFYGCSAVVNTIPMPQLYPSLHYDYVTAYVKTGTAPADEAWMMMHANPQVSWYRCSAVFGRFSMERTTPADGYTAVKKVIGFKGRETVPASDRNILYTGRQGAWNKSKTIDSAYTDTRLWLAENHE